MRDMVKLDYTKAKKFFREHELEGLSEQVKIAHRMLHEKSGLGNEYLGWLDLPINYDKEEVEKIKKLANRIREKTEVLLVVGIGGSYLGARAVIEPLVHTFYNTNHRKGIPDIYFVGNNLSSTYLSDLIDLLSEKEVSLIVISKSGTTTEPAIAFRILRKYMEDRYGEYAIKDRVFVITDKEKGALRGFADERGCDTFVIPDDVGGRYSVLTAVGLLPLAVAGVDIDRLLEGAKDAYNLYNNDNLFENDCYKYAAIRNILYRKNKTTEIMVNYEPSMHYFTEWWKQLFGESEGKDGKGIFPAGVDFPTDLHSMGQYIQDGLRNIFETVIRVENPRKRVYVEKGLENWDGLNFLADKDLDFVCKKAMEGTLLAHTDGGVPNLVVEIDKLDEYELGGMIYFFEKACAISGYLMGVNPFNQPGVEAYKKNMFALLGKPGFEQQREALEKRIQNDMEA